MAFSDLIDQALTACEATFGEDVVYTPQGGSGVTVKGIYSNETFIPEPGTGLKVLSAKPSLFVKLSSLAAAPRIGDQAAVRGTTYKVSDILNDGQGGSTLLLHRTS